MTLKPGQQKCIETLDRPIAVAAGAGSGKTYTLTKRIAGALESGYVQDIGQVLAITFTNKAAAELKSRVKAELRACGLIDQALKVDDAWISTIHGMCARILRAHAIQLGIDPSFAVADSANLKAYMAEAVDGVLREARDSGQVEGVDALFDEYAARSYGFGSSIESMLTQLVEKAVSNSRGTAAFVLPVQQESPAVTLVKVCTALTGQLEAARLLKQSASSESWIASTEDALAHASDVLAAGDVDAACALELFASMSVPRNFGSKEFKAGQAEAAACLTEAMLETRLSAALPLLQTLVQLANKVVERFTARKRAEGVLDNNDLLTMAAAAIEDNPDIAARYVDKFKLVMVDEFQDTDQMQVDMIKRLAGQGFERLCVVGDAQQSIYRFRGADVSVYRRHLQAVREVNPHGIIQLPDNFRSHADVLSFVDRIFEQPSMFGGEFMSLTHGRDEARVRHPLEQGAPRISVQLVSAPYSGVGSDVVRNEAAHRIAKSFADFARQGHSAGEMAVLLGTMTHAQQYAQALRDEGLSCVISGGSVFANTLETQMVLELVRFMANPHETQSLFNVLTGPMFALTAGDLVTLSTSADAEGNLHRRDLDVGVRALCAAQRNAEIAEPADWSPQLSCAIRALGSMRARMATEPVSRLVRDMAVSSGWITRMEAGGAEGQAQAGNVYKAIRMLEDIERSQAVGPSALARRFAETLACSKEAPGALSADGNDFVRIMTVHASKGLEFPIVAVAEFKDARASSSKLVTTEVGGSIFLSLDLDRTLKTLGINPKSSELQAVVEAQLGPLAGEEELLQAMKVPASMAVGRAAMAEYERLGDVEEAKRLLYVALTRAKEALVVSMKGTRTKDNPSGTPKSVFSSIVSAFAPTSGFDSGVTLVDFKGSANAVVEHLSLMPPDEDASEQDPTISEACDQASKQDRAPFMVPSASPAVPATRKAYRLDRSDVFSYSSISEASHEGDILEKLAAAYCVSVDEGLEEQVEYEEPAAVDNWALFLAGDEAEDFMRFDGVLAADSDKATDLGTAFHRLAQHAVISRVACGGLAIPDAGRIEALSRTCNLNVEARKRLQEALERWFSSEIAREMEAESNLSAEVPFFVRIDRDATASIYLEGEIDLLALSPDGACARVVDYKTGGRSAETVEELACKHVMQAACYAYALLRQGVNQVDAAFVRVERACALQNDQPQTVRYRFSRSDLPNLEQAITTVYSLKVQ